jgi:hypothetical protein
MEVVGPVGTGVAATVSWPGVVVAIVELGSVAVAALAATPVESAVVAALAASAPFSLQEVKAMKTTKVNKANKLNFFIIDFFLMLLKMINKYYAKIFHKRE